jgi:hypothetical protein
MKQVVNLCENPICGYATQEFKWREMFFSIKIGLCLIFIEKKHLSPKEVFSATKGGEKETT